MPSPVDLVEAARAARVADQYYALCDAQPLVLGRGLRAPKVADVLAAARGRLELLKLRGPGVVFSVGGLPPTVGLNVILSRDGMVETDFWVGEAPPRWRSTLCVVAREARLAAGLPARDPPYPRPVCAGADAFLDAVEAFRDMVLALWRAQGQRGSR